MSLTDRQNEIKEEFIAVRGTWSDLWESILTLDPEFLKAYLDFSAVPWREGTTTSTTRPRSSCSSR